MTVMTPIELADAGGLCAEVGGEFFFPEKGESSAPAKAVCARCPIRDICLETALEHDLVYGIWGGKSAPERKRIRRERRAAAS